MKKFLYYSLVPAALIMVMASCVNDDTDFDDILPQYQVEPQAIELDFSDLTEASDMPVLDENDEAFNDYVENSSWNKVINIHFDGNTATVTGTVAGVAVSTAGAHVTITNLMGPVKYVVTGVTTNGSLKFYGDKRFQVLLDGAEILNPNGAAINNQGNKTLYVVLADGSTNRLQDGTTYTMVDDEDQKAALFSEGQIIFSGSGSLNVIANGRNAIASDDYIRIRPGVKIYTKALARNGIKVNDGLWIDGGVLNIETHAGGAKGINCEANVNIAGGRTTIIGSGGVTIEEGDITSCAGIKCDSTLNMTGGTLNIKSTGEGGKGIRTNGNLIFAGGELNIVTTGEKGLSSPKGVKCDTDMSISGGAFYVYSVNAAALDVEGTFTLADGYVTQQVGTHYYIVDY